MKGHAHKWPVMVAWKLQTCSLRVEQRTESLPVYIVSELTHQDLECNWFQCASAAQQILSCNKLWYQPVLHLNVLQPNSSFCASFSWPVYEQTLSPLLDSKIYLKRWYSGVHRKCKEVQFLSLQLFFFWDSGKKRRRRRSYIYAFKAKYLWLICCLDILIRRSLSIFCKPIPNLASELLTCRLFIADAQTTVWISVPQWTDLELVRNTLLEQSQFLLHILVSAQWKEHQT